MANNTLPTPEQLRQLLTYDPDMGLFVWLARTPDLFCARHVQPNAACARWNTKLAGKPALTAKDKFGYCHGSILGVNIKAHRAAWAMTCGAWPNGHVDHINRDKSDNRISNLRVVSHGVNMQNLNARGTSQYLGVSKYRRGDYEKWVARMNFNGRQVHCSYWDTEEDAARAYDNAVRIFLPNGSATNF